MNDAGRAAGMADPFSGERQQYQTGLRDYMGANPVNPSQVTAGSNNALAMLTNLMQNRTRSRACRGISLVLIKRWRA